jgi:hypothetical protein
VEGNAHWLIGAVLVAGIAFIVLLVAYAKAAFSRYRLHRATLVCPATGDAVDVVIEQDLARQNRLDVCRCSGLPEPGKVDCHQGCLKQL